MSGHSKWHNRVHRKSRQDAKKGALYSKMAKEIMSAAKAGGPNPESNMRLKLAVERARVAGVPAENIQRAIRRGAGLEEGVTYEEIIYEGYAPGGVAVLLEIMTDNRNRTASEIRHLFNKNGGSLGETGCVAWMFQRKGIITFKETEKVDEDALMLAALEAGAEDLRNTDEGFQVVTAPDSLWDVKQRLEDQGYAIENAELVYEPQTEVEVEGREAEQVLNLLEILEEHDDVQSVYANAAIADEELAGV